MWKAINLQSSAGPTVLHDLLRDDNRNRGQAMPCLFIRCPSSIWLLLAILIFVSFETLLRITVSLVAEPARLGGSSLASLIPHSPPCLSNGNVQLCAKNAIQPSSYQWHYLSCPKSFMVWIGQQMEMVMCWCLTCNLECKTDTALSPARKVCDVISSRYHDGRRE